MSKIDILNNCEVLMAHDLLTKQKYYNYKIILNMQIFLLCTLVQKYLFTYYSKNITRK